MAGRSVFDGNTDPGVSVGNSTSTLVGFYGTAGTTQAAVISTVTTTGSSSTTNAFGYTTSTQADAIVTTLNQVVTYMRAAGMCATS